jgi:hypothetical protein
MQEGITSLLQKPGLIAKNIFKTPTFDKGTTNVVKPGTTLDQQITVLVSIINFPKKYESKLIQLVKNEYPNRNGQRNILKLIEMAGTPCGEEIIQENINRFNLFAKRIDDPSNGISEEDKEKMIDDNLISIARLLVDGYDLALPDNFVKDPDTGKMLVKEKERSRWPRCQRSLSGASRIKRKTLRKRKTKRRNRKH